MEEAYGKWSRALNQWWRATSDADLGRGRDLPGMASRLRDLSSLYTSAAKAGSDIPATR